MSKFVAVLNTFAVSEKIVNPCSSLIHSIGSSDGRCVPVVIPLLKSAEQGYILLSNRENEHLVVELYIIQKNTIFGCGFVATVATPSTDSRQLI
jgi:hypothetical protein